MFTYLINRSHLEGDHFTFTSTDATALAHADFGQGTGPIFLDNVQCAGTEDRLVHCPYDQNAVNCLNFTDASVHCQITRKYTTNKLKCIQIKSIRLSTHLSHYILVQIMAFTKLQAFLIILIGATIC